MPPARYFTEDLNRLNPEGHRLRADNLGPRITP